MKGQPNCPFCKGTGDYEMSGDLHRSAGIVPCYWKPVTVTSPKPDVFIVKVQLPLFTSSHIKDLALIYDQQGRHREERPLTPAEKNIIKGRLKVFCRAERNQSGGWDIIGALTNQNQSW